MDELLKLDNQLCFALNAAARCLSGAYQPLLESLGITYPQYLVLLTLWEEDGARMARIAERLQLDPAPLTPVLKRLEARGLIERRRSRADERIVEIHLTSAGRRLQRKVQALPKSVLDKSRPTPEQMARLRGHLQALTDTLLEIG